MERLTKVLDNGRIVTTEAENDALFRAKSEFEKENAALKAAIVRWFVRAFKEG